MLPPQTGERIPFEVPGGRVDQGQQSMTLRTRGRVQTVAEFSDIVVRESAIQTKSLRLRMTLTSEDHPSFQHVVETTIDLK